MFKIPFGWLPGHWGLKGKTRERAKAEYELEGYELDRKLVEIDYGDDEKKHAKELYKAMRKHDQISEYDYQVALAEESLTGVDLELRKLEIDLEHGKIDEQECAKRTATVRGGPYIAVINSTYDPALKLEGFEFEFDWNHLWIEQLITSGYSGVTEEQIVQRWFEDLCRTVVLENAEQEPIPFNSRRAVNRTVRDGGPTDYS